ncbi:MAG: TonB-dependent receptor plug domain-containing protein [Opitutales bacterium]|nr:TonB-dependent receptor plug domain-containing protein [Opitutales bacterium]
MKLTTRILPKLAYALFILPLSNYLVAQDGDDEIYELSPFSVDSSADVGYAAANTLAGSRMNTALRDTPAPISVYTAEFISDIGVDSMEEVLEYSVNMTPELSDQDGSFGANQLTAFDARYRVRGLDAGSARNYFETRLDQDVFNVERIDESRGPNSILFGLGLPGGVLNTSTKKPRFFEFTTLDITVGDADRFRTSIDVNRVLIEDKLAIRFNALYNKNGDPSRPSDHVYREDKRYHIAVQWRATESATFNVEWEHGDVVDSPTVPFGPSDRSSRWIESGRPAIGEGVGADQGIGGNYGTTRVTYIDNSGSIMDLNGQTQTTNPAYSRDNHFTPDTASINDPSKGPGGTVEVPIFAAVSGPWHMRGERDIDMINASYEQRLGENTNFEIVFAQHDYKRPTFRLGANNHLFGDANPTNRDGSTNPYFGELYFEAQIEKDNRSWKDEWLRASLSHEQDFDNWLGRHRIAAMWETQDGSFNRDSFINAWNDPNVTFGGPFHAVPDNARNRVYYRHYVTDPSKITDWRVGNDPARSGEGFSFTTEDGRNLTSTFVQNRSKRNTREIDSLMVATQSYFWNNRIIATMGVREDDFLNLSPPHFRNDVDNQRTEINFDNPSITSLSGERTVTYGVAYHVNNIVTLMANKANNAGLSAFAERSIMGASGEQGQAVPVPQGKSEDFGVMLELMEGKLVVTGSVYETAADRESSFASWNDINAVTGINNIYDNLSTGNPSAVPPIAPFITQAINDNQRTDAGGVITSSNSSEGWELSATANITENWQFTANTSYINSTVADTFSEFTPWWEGPTGKAFFSQFDQNFVFPDNGVFEPGVTLGGAIAQTESEANSVQARAGGSSPGQRHQKFNLFTNYAFTEGALANFSIGGGARYRSGATWTQTSTLGLQEFNGMTIFDLVGGYDTEMFGIPVQLQLNIRNLFDKDDFSVVRLSNAARPDGGFDVFKYVHTPGRDIRLRARFKF